MNQSTAESLKAPVQSGAAAAVPYDLVERAEIDASTRWPVMFFFVNAVIWLLIGTFLGLASSILLHQPGFFGDFAATTFGRLRPAHMNVSIYGWASSAGIGVAIWMMARLCRTVLRWPGMLIIAGILWNIGITIGVIGILAGDNTSIEWVEMPSYANAFLFAGFGLIAIWSLMMFLNRHPGHVYVSQWYLFGAFFWFPWLYSTANILLQLYPVPGVAHGVITWWYAHNIIGLWFTPLGLAGAYYFIPKVLGRPIHSYHLSLIGFWSFALFYNWLGMHHLIGGPIPAWLITVSTVASVMMIIPVVTVAINHHLTMKGNFYMLKHSPTLRFVVFGAMSYTLVSLQGISLAFRKVNELFHFTHHTIAHSHLGMYAFLTMILFGAMYYIIPRLLGREWPSAFLIKLHFWTAALGIAAMVLALSVGGGIQGHWFNNENIPFVEIIKKLKPWLATRSWTGALITIGHFAFAASVFMILIGWGRKRNEGPTLFKPYENK